MTLAVRSLSIPDLKLLVPRRFTDERGHFTETWSRKALRAAGIDCDFCQDNVSLSAMTGTVRGLHYQEPPNAQAKLVGVLVGRIMDVALDLRKSSATFGRHVSIELDAEQGAQLFIPRGFAHGFCTLAPGTLVSYKVDAHYAAPSDRGIFWADPSLGIAWPVAPQSARLSPKDAALPRFDQIVSPFP